MIGYLNKANTINSKSKVLELIIDSESEVSSLPTSTDKKDFGAFADQGSFALCLENSSVYFLSGDDTWVEI